MASESSALSRNDRWFISMVLSTSMVVLVLWAGAAVSAVASGHRAPPFELTAPVTALAVHAGDPAAAWGRPMGSAWLYWSSTAVVALALAVLAALAAKLVRGTEGSSTGALNLEGLAARREVAKAAGANALLI